MSNTQTSLLCISIARQDVKVFGISRIKENRTSVNHNSLCWIIDPGGVNFCASILLVSRSFLINCVMEKPINSSHYAKQIITSPNGTNRTQWISANILFQFFYYEHCLRIYCDKRTWKKCMSLFPAPFCHIHCSLSFCSILAANIHWILSG